MSVIENDFSDSEYTMAGQDMLEFLESVIATGFSNNDASIVTGSNPYGHAVNDYCYPGSTLDLGFDDEEEVETYYW